MRKHGWYLIEVFFDEDGEPSAYLDTTPLYTTPVVSVEAAVLAEREACAKVCDEAMIQMNYSEAPYKQCAAAIRARGEK